VAQENWGFIINSMSLNCLLFSDETSYGRIIVTYREHSIHLKVESVLLTALSGYVWLPVVFDSLCIHFPFCGLRHTHQSVFRTVTVRKLHERQEVFTVVSISVHAYDVFCYTGGFTVETYIRKSQKKCHTKFRVAVPWCFISVHSKVDTNLCC
jgi:hypothetical protein